MSLAAFIQSKLRQKPKPEINWRHPLALIATILWIGRLKTVQGAIAVLVATLVTWAVALSGGVVAFAIFAAVVIALGFISAHWVETTSGTHDASLIVIDEAAGIVISVLPLVLLGDFSGVSWLFAAVIFMILDMIKPWPISLIDRCLSGAAGVMIDDLVAGAITAMCVYLVVV